MGYLLEIAKRRNITEGTPVSTAHWDEINELNEISTQPKKWPLVSMDAERRFAQPHAKLFPFIGRKVRTPAGAGTLIQVFAERVTVVLESDVDKCAFFTPAEIEPASWELAR